MPATDIDFSRFTLRKDVAPHRQVAAYLKALIALGQVHPGETIPAPSALGYRLKVSGAEVKKAYTELVARGYLLSRGSKWLVSDEHGAASDEPALEEICDRLWDLVLEARQRGMTRSELQRMFATLLERS
jgi:DNA-binding transcriptional regulator YhcF (GntR family)